jgi:uncharacterized membrane protein
VPTRRTLPVDSRVIRIGVIVLGVAFLIGAVIMALTGHPRLFLVRGDPLSPPWSWLAALVMAGVGVALLAIGTRRGVGGPLQSPAFAGMTFFAAGALVATSGAQAVTGSLESAATGVEVSGPAVYVVGVVLLLIGLGLLILSGIAFVRAVEGDSP